MKPERKKHLSTVKKVVVKVGSSLVTDWTQKKIKTRFLTNLARQIHALQKKSIQCVIVTSGAIAAGLFELGFHKRPTKMAKLQALAAVGQSRLMQAYETTFRRFKVKVAQILLTRDDLSDRARYTNARNTFFELFRHGIVPIVNENDTVAIEEIRFGDNDTLAVLVSHLCEADLLVLLTDKDGFFNEDPVSNPNARLISDVYRWDDLLVKGAGRATSQVGTGGMLTKIQAAKNMMRSGIPMVIANGGSHSILTRILNSEKIGTFFHPTASKMPSRKRWLAWGGRSKGELVVDEGAEWALTEKNKSLLPSGIRSVSGTWNKGDIIRILNGYGKEIAKGISNYSSKDIDLIKGLKTSEIFQKIGPDQMEEVIHKDNIVKTGEPS
jgi:glutamate 5-kinase